MWPAAVVEYADNELVMSALGGCLAYLEMCQIAKQIFSQQSFSKYDPIRFKGDTMIVDSRGLATLEVLRSCSFYGLVGMIVLF
jgi:hypothetical protein